MKFVLCSAAALVAIANLAQSALAADPRPLVTTQPDPQADVAPFFVADTDPRWSGADWSADDIAALRKKVKYVFVIFNENRSFDHEYGTFPGVDGLYSDGEKPRAPADTPGFTQTYLDTVTGRTVTVQPFLVGPHENASFKDSTDHSHKGLAAKLDVEMKDGVPTAKMDKFAEVEWRKYAGSGSERGEKMGTQFARLVMAHMDCDTIPFFWRYASRFTIFDDIFATEDTPSTPNAIAMLAGQAGETQWVKHPSLTNQPAETGFTGAISGTINGKTYAGAATTQGPPLVNDPQPWWGSAFDNTALGREPTLSARGLGSGQHRLEPHLRLAAADDDGRLDQPLHPMGPQPGLRPCGRPEGPPRHRRGRQDARQLAMVSERLRPRADGHGRRRLAQGLRQPPQRRAIFRLHRQQSRRAGQPARRRGLFRRPRQKRRCRPTAACSPSAAAITTSTIRNRPPSSRTRIIPDSKGLTPDERAKIAKVKSGDDDHPAYSDSQLSEAMAARAINAIAGNPKLWEKSAIIIAYDESDGLYDHVPPRILSYGPDGLPLARGVRIPLILISPYARAHAVSHAEGDHNAVIETINALFGLPALSSLPDEKRALADGDSPRFNAFAPKGFAQKYLGPRDTPSPITDSLLSGFDKARVTGALPPLPASLALIPSDVVETFPHYGGKGCAAIGVTPENVRQNIPNVIPEGFNSLPATLPQYN